MGGVISPFGSSTAQYFAPTGLTGATEATRYVGGTASGAPVSGTFNDGDYIEDETGSFWICTVGGTPGTWVQVGGAAGFSNPMTTLGDLIYENATPAAARLAGDTSNTNKFLTGKATAGVAQAPAWAVIASADVPNNAANTSGTAANITQTLDTVPAPAADLSLNSKKITSLATPVSGTDAANKTYVDGVANGLSIKGSCQEATTAALSPGNTYLAGVLTATGVGTLTVDGQTVAANDRVLVKNEAAQANNGIYVCTVAGSGGTAYVLTRSNDMNTGAEVPGAFCFVEAGTVNKATGWVVAGAGPYTLGTTAIVWTQFNTGSVVSVAATDASIVVAGTASNPTIATGTLDVIATQHPPAAPVAMNSQKITGLLNGTAAQDAAAFGQVLAKSAFTGLDYAMVYVMP